MGLIVARVSELIFHQDENRHTVAYDRKAQQAAKNFHIDGRQLRLAMGEEEKVFAALRAELEKLLDKADVNPNDFAFRVAHTPVDADGLFHECTFHTTIGSAMPVRVL
jgi:hypothetical protein